MKNGADVADVTFEEVRPGDRGYASKGATGKMGTSEEIAAELKKTFEGWRIETVRPSKKGDISIEITLRSPLGATSALDICFDSFEGEMYLDGRPLVGVERD